MARGRFTDVQVRPTECLDVTNLTRDEFPQRIPPCADALHAPMAAWRLAGTPRTARRLRVSQPCPLPTPADRLLCIRVSLTTAALQGVPGRWFGMGQSQAQQWIPLLWPEHYPQLL